MVQNWKEVYACILFKQHFGLVFQANIWAIFGLKISCSIAPRSSGYKVNFAWPQFLFCFVGKLRPFRKIPLHGTDSTVDYIIGHCCTMHISHGQYPAPARYLIRYRLQRLCSRNRHLLGRFVHGNRGHLRVSHSLTHPRTRAIMKLERRSHRRGQCLDHVPRAHRAARSPATSCD